MKHNWRDSCPSNAFRSLFPPPPPVDLVINSVVNFFESVWIISLTFKSNWFWKWVVMQWFWEEIAVENKSASYEHSINLISWVLHGHLEEKEHYLLMHVLWFIFEQPIMLLMIITILFLMTEGDSRDCWSTHSKGKVHKRNKNEDEKKDKKKRQLEGYPHLHLRNLRRKSLVIAIHTLTFCFVLVSLLDFCLILSNYSHNTNADYFCWYFLKE